MPKTDETRESGPVIVQINDRRPDMPRALWAARYTDERAAQFLDVAGLHWKTWLGKTWLDGADERRAGGLYLFGDRANEAVGELEIRIFAVRERTSEITRASLPLRPAAAAE